MIPTSAATPTPMPSPATDGFIPSSATCTAKSMWYGAHESQWSAVEPTRSETRRSLRSEIASLNEGIGCCSPLPRTPSDVGLDVEQFVRVIEFAPRTRPDRYTILEHLAMTPDEIRQKIAEYTDAVASH